MTQHRPIWAPDEVEIEKPSTARMYDFYLGGSHNFAADRQLASRTIEAWPDVPHLCQANRAFLRRSVNQLASIGVDQFLDLGSGIPTAGNVHEVVHAANPGARVVYVDADAVAIAHSKALLAGNQATAVIEADLRQPQKILDHDTTRRLIDLSQPAGLLLVSVLPFIPDAEDPWQIAATLRDALAPGSYLVLAHATDDSRPVVAQAAEKVYNHSVSAQARMRSRGDILRFFDGFELVDPGLVHIPRWRPDPPADVTGDAGRFWVLAGVARKA